ncbi:MAG: hypothetical protein QG565_554 [Campylobacterota bacterium]|nr:hypothetical protein [Campylobacterota bacterium]MDQ1267877.1 hypothetical protein [Campylobacterota bacterium]MDQ1337919.1 hypothetical protein [Campylobacterota bacterium]
MSNLLVKFETPVLYTLSFVWIGIIATYIGVSFMLVAGLI